jgi:outer membrane receptor protein involved in Fe transport
MANFGRGSLALVGVGIVGMALAQAAAAADTEDEELLEVVVTGSRITASVGMAAPTPVTAVSAEELAALSPSTLISALSQLPQFYGNTNNDVRTGFFSSPGSGNLNLRGLNTGGSGRTLTLLDGRRVVPATGLGSVDINILPSALVKRVETVTGGASAAYGTDAVAGAVNFILDTDYTGWQVNAQAGTTSRSDRNNTLYSAAWGGNLGDRAHLLLSAEYYEADPVGSLGERNWYQGVALIANPLALNVAGNFQPAYVPRTNVVSAIATHGGLICGSSSPACNVPTTSALYRRYFQPDGTLAPFELGEGTSPATTPPGNFGAHAIANGGSGDDATVSLLDLAPKARRSSAFLYLDYDATPNLNLYVQGLMGTGMVDQPFHGGRFAAVSGLDTRITILRDNPFLPTAVRDIMVAENLTSFQMNVVGDHEGLGRYSRQKQDNRTKSGTAGFKWDLVRDGMLQDWQVNGYAQYGTADNTGYQQGPILDRFYAAIDAVVDPDDPDNIVCHAATVDPARYGDCVPLNLFGAGNASDAAIAYISLYTPGQSITTPLYFQPDGYDSGKTVTYRSGLGKVYNTNTRQTVVDLAAQGKVWDGWAGPIAAAIGVDYRKEQIEQIVHDPSNPASDPGLFPASAAVNPALRNVPSNPATRSSMLQNSTVANVHGSYTVKEAFTEWQVPLLAGLPGVQQLNLLAAARYADYSGSGGVWSWKTGLDWQVASALRLRGTVSRDLRAATLLERFNQTGGVGTIVDPFWVVGGVNQSHGVSTRTGGNPELGPETSKTFTYGFVFQPDGLPGFSMSADYWDVDISGAIGNLGTQRIVTDCFNSGATASVCSLLSFDADGHVAQVRNITQNIAAAAGRGVDVEVGYRRAIQLFREGGERVGLRMFWSHLSENSTQTDRSNPVTYTNFAGQVGAGSLPADAITGILTYGAGPFHLSLAARHIGKGVNNAAWNRPLQRPEVTDNTIGSVTYLNIEGGYAWDKGGGNLELYVDVQNLFDRDPPMVPQLFDNSLAQAINNGGTNSGLYDMLGRRFTVGVRFRH